MQVVKQILENNEIYKKNQSHRNQFLHRIVASYQVVRQHQKVDLDQVRCLIPVDALHQEAQEMQRSRLEPGSLNPASVKPRSPVDPLSKPALEQTNPEASNQISHPEKNQESQISHPEKNQEANQETKVLIKDDFYMDLMRCLLKWFKQFFKWVNQLECCGPCTCYMGQPTPQEQRYGAHRVEVYVCQTCHGQQRFPRYKFFWLM